MRVNTKRDVGARDAPISGEKIIHLGMEEFRIEEDIKQ